LSIRPGIKVNDSSRTPLQSPRRARHTGFWERLHCGAAVINQRALSETEICDRISVRGRLVSRGRRKRADYLLVYEGVPLGVIEAKDNSHAMGDGLQQALAYAESLNTPFVFASNGDGFVQHDRTGQSEQRETSLALDAFPSPEELWRRYSIWRGFTAEQGKVVLQPYFDCGSRKDRRSYQVNAIKATVEAITKGQQRILLVMATGTGKTFTAFQIIWRLWKAGQKKRILFLADRNVLVNQRVVNDFRPFGSATTPQAEGLSTDGGRCHHSRRREELHRCPGCLAPVGRYSQGLTRGWGFDE